MPNQTDNDRADILKDQYGIEKVAKILSLVAIPIVIAVFGWIIQDGLSKRNMSQEYVKLAMSILEKPKSSEVPAGLRDWAVDLLNQNSPTKLSAETIHQLKTGEINLSGFISNLIATSNNGSGMAYSPDARYVATGQADGRVAVWEVSSGRLLKTISGHTDSVTAVAYTPDAHMLISGSYDNTVRGWSLASGKELLRLTLTSPVIGLGVSPDGSSITVRSLDGELQVFDIKSGRFLSKVQLRAKSP